MSIDVGAINYRGEDGSWNPIAAIRGEKGEPGNDGEDGLSAYDIAVDNGFEGTEEEWVASLGGKAGTVKVGSVSTGANPSVVNVGTDSEAVLNFVFPSGGSGGQMIYTIEYVLTSDASMPYCKGGTAGVLLYVTGTNDLYQWTGTAWDETGIVSDALYMYRGQLYSVLNGVVWGIGNDWGSNSVRSYISKDESGNMSVSLVSDASVIRVSDLPACLAYGTGNGVSASMGSNKVKSVDFTGCAPCSIGTSTSTDDSGLQGLFNCQELLLPINSTVYGRYLLAGLNSGGITSATTLFGNCIAGRRRPRIMFGGRIDEGTGPSTGYVASYCPQYVCADVYYKQHSLAAIIAPNYVGGTIAQFLTSKPDCSNGGSVPCILNVLHFDCWGMLTVSATSFANSWYIMKNASSHDCVFEWGSSAFPVTQSDLDSWGLDPYWVVQSSTGRVIVVFYTEGGAELTVPEHSYAADLVVVFKDAAIRTREAFDAKYDFATMFNTSTTEDPRPDLSDEGVEYV